MKALDAPFTKIVNGSSQFIIPVFQRDYTWKAETDCAQLWQDVLRVARRKEEGGHFLGSIVYISTGDTQAAFTRWLLIDGQQRLTTLTLLLAALRDHIRDTGWTGDDNDPTAKRIEAYFLKNVQEEGNRQQKLVLRRRDQATLTAILDNLPSEDWPDNPSERIQENYSYFRDQLTAADPAEVYSGVGRLVVVDVSLDRQMDDPQLIFESLNSTGVDLSQADLIRNFILMRLPEKEQTSLYETYWSKIEALFQGYESVFDVFARDYVALKTQSSKQERADEVYYAFRNLFPQLVQDAGSLEDALAEVLRYARYYAMFRIGRGVTGPRAESLSRLRQLVDVPAILVMRLLDSVDRLQIMEEQELIEAVALIESYVLRRAVCGLQTRGYWQIFAAMSYKVRDGDALNDLKVELARQQQNYRFPPNEEFTRALMEGDLYGLRVCRYVLERLENHETKEPSDTSEYSIEHIMPQNERLSTAWREMLGAEWKDVQKTWLHRLGNLTLTAYNSEYQDKAFEDKKTVPGGFAYSAVRLNKFVREQSVWTAREMVKRTEMLTQRARQIWSALSVDQSLIDAAYVREMRELASRRDVARVKMTSEARALFEVLRKDVLGLDSDILELAETNSISYHSPGFFLEILPRRYRLTLLLALDFADVHDPSGLAQDASEWKFFTNAKYGGGVTIRIDNLNAIDVAMPIIRKAYTTSRE